MAYLSCNPLSAALILVSRTNGVFTLQEMTRNCKYQENIHDTQKTIAVIVRILNGKKRERLAELTSRTIKCFSEYLNCC